MNDKSDLQLKTYHYKYQQNEDGSNINKSDENESDINTNQISDKLQQDLRSQLEEKEKVDQINTINHDLTQSKMTSLALRK